MTFSKAELQRYHNHFNQYRTSTKQPNYIQKKKEFVEEIIALSAHGFGVPEIREIVGGGQIGQICEIRMEARRKNLW